MVKAQISMRKVLGSMFVCLFVVSVGAFAQTAREQLAQMLDVLQKTPKDDAVRESIIRLARDLKPAPPIPEEARRALIRGNTALEEATGVDDYARAARHYEDALALAPWWGPAYLSLARAQELQFDYRSAQRNMRFYTLTGISAEDVRKAQDYLYALEEKQERADKTRAEFDSKFGWLNGQWRLTRKLLDRSGYAVAETDPVPARSNVEGNRVTLRVSADTMEHDHRHGGSGSYGSYGAYDVSPTRVDDTFRVSYDSSGQLVMEIYGARDRYTCPVAYDWNPIQFVVSTDQRTITATREDLYGPPNCQPSGYSITWVLERAP
jgi:hypothetical protein